MGVIVAYIVLSIVLVYAAGFGLLRISKYRSPEWPAQTTYVKRMKSFEKPMAWHRRVAGWSGAVVDVGWRYGVRREGRTTVYEINSIAVRPFLIALLVPIAAAIWLVLALPLLIVILIAWLVTALPFHWLWHEMKPSSFVSRRKRRTMSHSTVRMGDRVGTSAARRQLRSDARHAATRQMRQIAPRAAAYRVDVTPWVRDGAKVYQRVVHDLAAYPGNLDGAVDVVAGRIRRMIARPLQSDPESGTWYAVYLTRCATQALRREKPIAARLATQRLESRVRGEPVLR